MYVENSMDGFGRLTARLGDLQRKGCGQVKWGVAGVVQKFQKNIFSSTFQKIINILKLHTKCIPNWGGGSRERSEAQPAGKANPGCVSTRTQSRLLSHSRFFLYRPYFNIWPVKIYKSSSFRDELVSQMIDLDCVEALNDKQ